MKPLFKDRNFWFFAVIILFAAGAGTYVYNVYRVSYEQVSAACAPGQFCSGFVSPSSVAAGGSYIIGCDYGFVGSGIYADPGSGTCTYSKFAGKTAEFSCKAGSAPGTFANACRLSTPAHYAQRTDAVSSLSIKCPAGQFCGSALSTSTVAPGASYTMSCDYGFVGNGIYADPGSGTCTYSKFAGTAAEFSCTAGNTAGTFPSTCKLSAPAPYAYRSDAAPSLTVSESAKSSGGNAGIPSSTAADLIPSSAVAASNLDLSSSWEWEHDTGTQGGSSGTSQIVAKPSIDGYAREFAFSYTSDGGERYHLTFAKDTSATHFVYDTWVDLATPKNIQNLELDMNQVMADGRTVIFGTQCASGSKTWEYTSEVPKGHWIASNIPCDPTSWTANTWHHVQIATQRDASGNVTYDWVSLDGKVSYFKNATANTALSSGWHPGTLLINFQIDGKNGTGSVTAYADKLTIWRW